MIESAFQINLVLIINKSNFSSSVTQNTNGENFSLQFHFKVRRASATLLANDSGGSTD